MKIAAQGVQLKKDSEPEYSLEPGHRHWWFQLHDEDCAFLWWESLMDQQLPILLL